MFKNAYTQQVWVKTAQNLKINVFDREILKPLSQSYVFLINISYWIYPANIIEMTLKMTNNGFLTVIFNFKPFLKCTFLISVLNCIYPSNLGKIPLKMKNNGF